MGISWTTEEETFENFVRKNKKVFVILKKPLDFTIAVPFFCTPLKVIIVHFRIPTIYRTVLYIFQTFYQTLLLRVQYPYSILAVLSYSLYHCLMWNTFLATINQKYFVCGNKNCNFRFQVPTGKIGWVVVPIQSFSRPSVTTVDATTSRSPPRRWSSVPESSRNWSIHSGCCR